MTHEERGIYSEQLERVAKALESIAESLTKLANPLLIAETLETEHGDQIYPRRL